MAVRHGICHDWRVTWQIVLGVVGAIFLVLMVFGYFVGPQGNQRPVTKRDQDIMDRRAVGDTPRQRRRVLDAYTLARKAVEDARELVASGLEEDVALAQGFRNLLKNPHKVTNYGEKKMEYLADTLGIVTNILMEHGVLNTLDDKAIMASGITVPQMVQYPEVFVSACGVRDLNAWP